MSDSHDILGAGRSPAVKGGRMEPMILTTRGWKPAVKGGRMEPMILTTRGWKPRGGNQ